ncbi:MAG: hypothetical protein E5Y83_34645 [Mesorhizobium sp.]|nr:MAG: hypothetical protein E5Y85_16165 [Mesorhizobium sp.]TIL47084.1 MAG: hypothetical protein E5Y83_34645 [Mesorhizobium sp.]
MRQHSGQHPSTVLALRANPPSPTRGEGKSALLPPRVANSGRRRKRFGSPFSTCGRRWPQSGRMRGVPAWHRQHSGQHPSTVLALRANPPSPTRGKRLTAHSERNSP